MRTLLPACLLLALAGCGDSGRLPSHGSQPGVAAGQDLVEAVAVLTPTRGSSVHGVIRFRQRGETLQISGEVAGLTPGPHGFHIHEWGDTTAPDGTSAGDHYNPEGHAHAGLDSRERHAGDLGNILADAEGRARVELSVDMLTIAGARNPVLGRSVVVHEKADDLATQPSGAAGPRIAVGVIGAAQPAP